MTSFSALDHSPPRLPSLALLGRNLSDPESQVPVFRDSGHDRYDRASRDSSPSGTATSVSIYSLLFDVLRQTGHLIKRNASKLYDIVKLVIKRLAVINFAPALA
ncbi:hypothetical protein CVT26_003942 [Gymnopilus dilepis]|uniref:Uncharacterized protein n=1 Tax=Gymnopilus dilepis TaxID=231916 RepID=A0A409WKF0_9AGAR|nr:hypothetical protein CVT26_003942 [Gymnopilus dilepis]